MAVAPGKLILLGEHSAVFGYPAVGIPLPLYTRVDLLPRMKQGLFPGMAREQVPVLQSLVDSLPGGPDPDRISIGIRSGLPPGAGLGSSAALCTALVRAFFPGLDDRGVWERAHRAEKIFHGHPSGIDTGLSALAGPLIFHPAQGILPRISPVSYGPSWLVVCALPRSDSTRNLIAQIKARHDSRDPVILTGLSLLGNNAATLIQRTGAISPQVFGGLCTSSQEVLAGWGLSLPVLDDFLAESPRWDARGGKFSGAGGGGAFFTVYSSRKEAENGKAHTIQWFGERGVSLLMEPLILRGV